MITVEEELNVCVDGHAVVISWHAPEDVPDGKRHGSAAVCVTASGEILVVQADWGWNFPGGRPEGDETWEATMRREVLEEACATVTDARLLGFARSRILDGPEAGSILVRSFWRAEVEVGEWRPQFEMTQRRAVSPGVIFSYLPEVFAPVFRRVLTEAGFAKECG